MSGINVTVQELLDTFQERFPREYEMCVLSLSNTKLMKRVAELEQAAAAGEEQGAETEPDPES